MLRKTETVSGNRGYAYDPVHDPFVSGKQTIAVWRKLAPVQTQYGQRWRYVKKIVTVRDVGRPYHEQRTDSRMQQVSVRWTDRLVRRAALRHIREHGPSSISAICRVLGVSHIVVNRRMKFDDWFVRINRNQWDINSQARIDAPMLHDERTTAIDHLMRYFSTNKSGTPRQIAAALDMHWDQLRCGVSGPHRNMFDLTRDGNAYIWSLSDVGKRRIAEMG